MKIMLIAMILGAAACSELNQKVGLKDDNDVEQLIEKKIEENTGAKIDFTPEKL